MKITRFEMHTQTSSIHFLSPYSFNGMENDDEVKGEGNSYTTYFRQNDPRLGRWLSPDPVFQPQQSPYCSMNNNPIAYCDILGDIIDYGVKGKAKRELKKNINSAIKNDDKFKELYNFWEGDENLHTLYPGALTNNTDGKNKENNKGAQQNDVPYVYDNERTTEVNKGSGGTKTTYRHYIYDPNFVTEQKKFDVNFEPHKDAIATDLTPIQEYIKKGKLLEINAIINYASKRSKGDANSGYEIQGVIVKNVSSKFLLESRRKSLEVALDLTFNKTTYHHNGNSADFVNRVITSYVIPKIIYSNFIPR